MKKWTRYLVLALTLALSLSLFGLAGCSLFGGSSGKEIASADLVGTWQEVDIDNRYVFKSDGTGSEYLDGKEFKMKSWKIDGDLLIMDFVDAEVEKYTISLNGDTLQVNGALGIQYVYKRQ